MFRGNYDHHYSYLFVDNLTHFTVPTVAEETFGHLCHIMSHQQCNITKESSHRRMIGQEQQSGMSSNQGARKRHATGTSGGSQPKYSHMSGAHVVETYQVYE